MTTADPVADVITRIRNGITARHRSIDVPRSKLKVEIARLLREEGYLSDYKIIDDGPQGVLRMYPAYAGDGQPVLTGLKCISRPGLRVYKGKTDIPTILDGIGVAIVSTSKGIMSGHACREAGVGGEVLFKVW